MKSSVCWSVIALLLVGAMGCGTSETSQGSANGPQVHQDAPKFAKATLHINGFKKSKSGAI